MLAQNFKTPVDLGITDDDYTGLRTVLGMLERDEIKSVDFDMRELCGTACCICGWAHVVTDGRAFPEVAVYEAGGDMPSERFSSDLMDLFYLKRATWRAGGIKPEHAAIAVRNYLTDGKPRWHEARAS